MMLQRMRLQTLADTLRRYNPVLLMDDWQTCACGYAARLPEFNVLGLRFVDARPLEFGRIRYESSKNAMEAIGLFFGLDWLQTAKLFIGANINSHDVSPVTAQLYKVESGVEVADRIDLFLQSQALEVPSEALA